MLLDFHELIVETWTYKCWLPMDKDRLKITNVGLELHIW